MKEKRVMERYQKLMIGVALALPFIPLSKGMRKVDVYGFIYIAKP